MDESAEKKTWHLLPFGKSMGSDARPIISLGELSSVAAAAMRSIFISGTCTAFTSPEANILGPPNLLPFPLPLASTASGGHSVTQNSEISKSNNACSTSWICCERATLICSSIALSVSIPYLKNIVTKLSPLVFPNFPSYPLQESKDGDKVGCEDGDSDGCDEGCEEGCDVGCEVGSDVGCEDGGSDGSDVGCEEGEDEGCMLGLDVGDTLGNDDGTKDGSVVGDADGCSDGDSDG